MRTLLITLTSTILVFMVWEIIDTSFESNLFEALPSLVSIPWMEATLYDFYANALFICAWIAYKEKNILKKAGWLMVLITMGSVATCLYIIKELLTLGEKEELKTLLTKQNN